MTTKDGGRPLSDQEQRVLGQIEESLARDKRLSRLCGRFDAARTASRPTAHRVLGGSAIALAVLATGTQAAAIRTAAPVLVVVALCAWALTSCAVAVWLRARALDESWTAPARRRRFPSRRPGFRNRGNRWPVRRRRRPGL
ncbi:DUF3040 domain-containing protein [Streptomyces sp. SID3343]|uniref:DUF3040 domain-containing protein n=1 Tax=Streptomyces sp. SID3343 TaxID=2690260 RepID=UPI001367EF89|nr:DUF3040 domain-containing protein [Streptomyces sp. SID3343]MYW02702.1 DUF3040 domain-containing protein [Streptomyces sp. SID3343]